MTSLLNKYSKCSKLFCYVFQPQPVAWMSLFRLRIRHVGEMYGCEIVHEYPVLDDYENWYSIQYRTLGITALILLYHVRYMRLKLLWDNRWLVSLAKTNTHNNHSWKTSCNLLYVLNILTTWYQEHRFPPDCWWWRERESTSRNLFFSCCGLRILFRTEKEITKIITHYNGF